MKTKKDKEIYLMVCFIIVVYVHSMVNVDTLPDLPHYKEAFKETFNLPWIKCLSWGNVNYKIEPGYLLFYKAVSVISHNFQFFLWINSFVLLSLYFIMIKKYSPYYALSVLFLLLGPFNQSTFVLRQHLAAAILLASFPFIRDRQQLKFLFVSFLAFFIHQSALIFIPIYYLYNLNRKNLKITIFIMGISLYLEFQAILIWGASITKGNEIYLYTEEGGGMNFKPALLGIFTLFVYWSTLRRHVFDEGINRFLFVLTSVGTVFLIAGVGYEPAGRLSIYFTSCHFLLYPIIFSYMNKAQFARNFMLLLFLALGYYGAFVVSSWHFIEHLKLVSFL